jgi:hypothetical protein
MSLDKASGERLPDYLGDPRLTDKPQSFRTASPPLFRSMVSIWVTGAMIARESAPVPSAGPDLGHAKRTFKPAGNR